MQSAQNILVSSVFSSFIFFLLGCGPAPRESRFANLNSFEKVQAPLPEGIPCPGREELNCYSVSMPLNHSQPNDRRMTVRFAVRPASAPSAEVLLVLFGGPGDPGVYALGEWVQRISPALKERFHIVTMDLRGVDGSEAMDCPKAAYDFGFVPPWTYSEEETSALAAGAEAASSGCLRELARSPEILQHYNTKQAAADLEAFRRLMGYDAWSIYSLSYGTQLAQTYVRKYPGRTKALVLDGAVDLTANLLDYGRDLALAQNKIFTDLDPYCKATPVCRQAFSAQAKARGKSQGMTLPSLAYDQAFKQLLEQAAEVKYSAADGSAVESTMTAYDLEFALSGAVGNPRKRARFLWALSQTLQSGDFTPLYRLVDGSSEAPAEPALSTPAETAAEAPQMSQGVFWTFICNDYGRPSGQTFKERFGRFVANAAPHQQKGLRIHAPFFSESLCAAWPVAEKKQMPAPLKAEGLPTMVIGAEADANVPYQHSVQIAAHLSEGRLITVSGSQHISYSYHISCVNEKVDAFLLSGKLPAEKTFRCEDEFVGAWPADQRKNPDVAVSAAN